MALSPEEMALLEELEAEDKQARLAPAPARNPSAPSRQPGDTEMINILSPEEQALMLALEDEFPEERNATTEKNGEGLLSQIGSIVDQYSGAASTRKAVNTLVEGGGIRQAASDFAIQYGQDPNLAPTGMEIAENMGLDNQSQYIKRPEMMRQDDARAFNRPIEKIPNRTEVISPAELTGIGIDLVADPTNLIGLVPFTKMAKVGGGYALKGSVKAAKATESFTGLPLTAVGNGVETVGKASAETLKKTKTMLSKAFRPEVSDDFNELSRIAAENDIPEDLINEAHKYGEGSVVSRYARNNAEGLGGLEKHEALVQAVSEATENKIRKISKVSSIPDDIEAGAILREAHDEGVDNFFSQMGETYNNAVKMAPGMRLDKKSQAILNSKINEWETWARGRAAETKDLEKVIDSGSATKGQINKATGQMVEALASNEQAITNTARSQAKEVLIASQRMRNAVASGDVKQVYSIMREIGDIAFKAKNSLAELPSDVRKFQEMYFANQKALTETIRKSLGDEFADKLVENNSAMSKFFSHRGDIAPIIGNKSLSDEKVFQSLIMNGDSKKIEALQSIISPEAFDKLRATFLYKVIKPGADGVINFKAARKELLKLKQSGKLKLMLNADEITGLDEVLRFGDRGGFGVLSTSGTGASGKLSNLVGTVKDHIAGETLIDSIKNNTRANYVEVSGKTTNGKKYTELIKKPDTAKPKSGIARLKEASPVSKRQAAKGAQVESIQERNKKLKGLKGLRGN